MQKKLEYVEYVKYDTCNKSIQEDLLFSNFYLIAYILY